MTDRAQVRNAADPEQVKRAGRRDRRLSEERSELVQQQLSTYQGRRFVWEELERHHLYETITRQSSEIYVLSGRRDAGLELLTEVLEHAELYLLMQQEAINRAQRDNRSTDAAHTPSAQQGAQ